MNNFSAFLDYLIERSLKLNNLDVTEDDEQVKISFSEEDRDIEVYFEVIFYKNDTFIQINTKELVTFSDEELMYNITLVNSLNEHYSGITFIVDKNNIKLKSGIFIDDNFNPSIIIFILTLMLKESINLINKKYL